MLANGAVWSDRIDRSADDERWPIPLAAAFASVVSLILWSLIVAGFMLFI